MRHYPVNSPRASARILALAANSQGGMSRAQLDAVRYLRVFEQLDLEPSIWHEVLTTLYTDLLPTSQRNWASVFLQDSASLDAVLDEVKDPQLRYQVFRLSTALSQLEHPSQVKENPVREAIQERWPEAAVSTDQEPQLEEALNAEHLTLGPSHRN